jgi:hypothetical protein
MLTTILGEIHILLRQPRSTVSAVNAMLMLGLGNIPWNSLDVTDVWTASQHDAPVTFIKEKLNTSMLKNAHIYNKCFVGKINNKISQMAFFISVN